MLNSILDFLSHGLLRLSAWQIVVVALVFTHITIIGVTVYLHRCQAHRALDLHPIASHFFRLWLWLSTGMQTGQWAAIHRKHHAKCETEEDPHSPQTRGIWKVLLEGAELYRAESKNEETMRKFSHGTPDDWMERKLYSRYPILGVSLMMVIDVALFGVIGLTVWAVQMIWIPFWAAGVINGLAHFWGYRNFNSSDASTNILPWGILIGGEELHNNHHAYGTSAKFSTQWYEFDLGWMYIRGLSALKLATVRKVAPQLKLARVKPAPDLATLHAVITHRYHVATSYARTLKAACASELASLKARAAAGRAHEDVPTPSRMKHWLLVDPATLTEAERVKLAAALAKSKGLATIYAMRQDLSALWERSTESSEQLLARLQDWCHRAEASGIAPLAQFSLQLKRYA